MIVVKASIGLVIEFGVGESGKWDTLTVRLAEGLLPVPLRFEVSASPGGRLIVRPLEARGAAELVVALGAVLAHEPQILAEVRKYARS